MSPEPIRDQAYYLETVVFQVENTLFKVPRFQFERHSGIFATTFSLPKPVKGPGAEGSSDKTPFKLNGIKCVDFRRLLRVLYPMTPIAQTPSLSQDEWISVLKLANLWDFIEVRNLAIKQLTPYSESLDCIERILFGRKFDVSAWLRSGYSELARRKAAISSREAEKIGWEVALQICQIREATVLAYSDQNPYRNASLGDVFRAEFKRADSAHEPLSPVPRIATARPTESLSFSSDNNRTAFMDIAAAMKSINSFPHTATALNLESNRESATRVTTGTAKKGAPPAVVIKANAATHTARGTFGGITLVTPGSGGSGHNHYSAGTSPFDVCYGSRFGSTSAATG